MLNSSNLDIAYGSRHYIGMSDYDHVADLDDFFERVGEELYPDHEAQAIQDFTADLLKSVYGEQPDVMVPAVRAYREAQTLQTLDNHASAVIFAVAGSTICLTKR